ncbi:hypothetical protein [Roseovarius sp. MMSF_3281]|uniref:hypothetical protein n=1 Tax=Roseovarius sp. MMSF_3281 TaxID=3046694 RepID=UPI00273F1434|nr:hypothetical protein [Roseovarius sp. MMSF_3281]
MVAFPDNSETFIQNRLQHDGKPLGCALKRAMKMGFGTAFLLAALGMWGMPAADAEMQLIKLCASLVMLGIGLMLVSALDAPDDLPEVHIDSMNRQLRVVSMDACGHMHLRGVYDLDKLSRVSLEGHALTALDDAGQKIVSIPLTDPEAEQALRDLFPQAA